MSLEHRLSNSVVLNPADRMPAYSIHRRRATIATALACTLLTGACGLNESPINRKLDAKTIDALPKFTATSVSISKGTTIRLDPLTIDGGADAFVNKYNDSGDEITSNACKLQDTSGTTSPISLPGMKLVLGSDPKNGGWLGLDWYTLPSSLTNKCPEPDADGLVWAIAEKIDFETADETAMQDALQKIADAADYRHGG